MVMRTIGALALLTGMLSVSACIDDSYSPAKQYCDSVCDGLDRCWEVTEHQPCVRECLEQPWLESASDASLAELADCIERQSCKKYLSGAGFRDCWQDASDEAVPDEQCRLICEAYDLGVRTCGANYVSEKYRCLALPCDLAEGEMASVAACAEDRSCDAYPACANAFIPDPDG
jgi:hypothetical protein